MKSAGANYLMAALSPNGNGSKINTPVTTAGIKEVTLTGQSCGQHLSLCSYVLQSEFESTSKEYKERCRRENLRVLVKSTKKGVNQI
jgi:hypothetical protein